MHHLVQDVDGGEAVSMGSEGTWDQDATVRKGQEGSGAGCLGAGSGHSRACS